MTYEDVIRIAITQHRVGLQQATVESVINTTNSLCDILGYRRINVGTVKLVLSELPDITVNPDNTIQDNTTHKAGNTRLVSAWEQFGINTEEEMKWRAIGATPQDFENCRSAGIGWEQAALILPGGGSVIDKLAKDGPQETKMAIVQGLTRQLPHPF